MREEGKKGHYLLGIKDGSIVIGIKDFHYGHSRGGGAVPIHVCSLDGQCVFRDFLGEKRRVEGHCEFSLRVPQPGLLEAETWENVEGRGTSFSQLALDSPTYCSSIS